MKSQLFIPKVIKVGCQHRSDTYTKKLAYVIYYDNKGVLRKEQSWRGWIHEKDQENHWTGTYQQDSSGAINYNKPVYDTLPGIPPEDFENIPTEGFVLNKGAGGHAGSSSSWNTRRETIRVYDPRDFEFEISVANLLFILENASSHKGKGLEGKFVYSWDGKDLVLLPEGCKEYQDSVGFTELKDKKVSIKDLVLGGTYLTKSQDEWIYLGKLDRHSFNHPSTGKGKYSYDGKSKTQVVEKFHTFLDKNNNYIWESGGAKLGAVISDTPVSNYAELMDEYYNSKYGTKAVSLEFVLSTLTTEELEVTSMHSYLNRYIFEPRSNSYIRYEFQRFEDYDYGSDGYPLHTGEQGTWTYLPQKFRGYKYGTDRKVSMSGDKIIYKNLEKDTIWNKNSGVYRSDWKRRTFDYEYLKQLTDIEEMNLGELYVVLESGTKIHLEKY